MRPPSDTPDALTEDAWFRATLAQMSAVHDARVQFRGSFCGQRNELTCDINNDGGYHVLGVAAGVNIVEAFARPGEGARRAGASGGEAGARCEP